MAPSWQHLRKAWRARRRRWMKRATQACAGVASLWLRFPDEAAACPACASSRLSLLDVLRVRADLTGRRLAFLTGCEACGLLFCNPLPSPERLDAFYGDTGVWAQEHGEHAAHLAAVHERRMRRRKPAGKRAHGRTPPPLVEAVARHVPVAAPPPHAKAIDFGCGTGKFLNWLQDFGWDTYGIEPSLDVAFLRHGRLATPPRDGSFDFAILHHVLEHVRNPLDILRQLAGSLKEGGLLFISVPRLDTLPQHADFHYCINGRNHLVAFTDACLRTLLARSGFDVVARLDEPDLDQALTDGQPLRMRVIARRTASPAAPPGSPLDAARRALRAYARVHRTRDRVPVPSPIPVRLRAGWMQRKM